MDMSQYSGKDKLKEHCEAIRRNQISVGLAFLYLAGYEVELHYIGKPDAWSAKEVIDELEYTDQTAIWSVSTTSGGVWETWMRDAIKYGSLDQTESWNRWNRRISEAVK